MSKILEAFRVFFPKSELKTRRELIDENNKMRYLVAIVYRDEKNTKSDFAAGIAQRKLLIKMIEEKMEELDIDELFRIY